MTTRRALTMLLTAALGAGALSGCGASVPENPTWVADVRPIMVARCVRCHDGAVGESDPLVHSTSPPLGDFSHQSFSDFSDGDKSLISMAGSYVESTNPTKQMPPPPAAVLADWEIQTIKNWLKHMQ